MFARRSFIVFCLALIGVIVTPAVASAVDYGGLGGLPANPDPNNPRTKSIFVMTLKKGGSATDGVKVVNNTGQTKDIEVYATDSEVASGGSFTCAQKVTEPKQVGRWIKLSKNSLQLPNNGTEVVPFTVLVPLLADVGEHDGCIVIQAKDGGGGPSGNGVQLSFRSALRVAITVPGKITKSLEFSDLSVKPGDEKYIITATLKNKGNVSLDADIKVDVKNCLGRKVYSNGGTYPLLAQTQPTDLNYEFPRPFWGGFYKSVGTAHYNNDPNQPLGAGPKNGQTVGPSHCFYAPPKKAAAIIELILLAMAVAVILWFVLFKRRRKQQAKKWQTFVVDPGDTINSLARDFHVSWKQVAKMNKLKAPYELKPGSKIKLPVDPKKR